MSSCSSSRGGLDWTTEEAHSRPDSALTAVPSGELLDSTPPWCSHLEIRGFDIVLGPSV